MSMAMSAIDANMKLTIAHLGSAGGERFTCLLIANGADGQWLMRVKEASEFNSQSRSSSASLP